MEKQDAQSLVSYIPFRALLSISKSLGGVGADPHRLPGGKQGFADALIARYGADAILKQWSKDKQDAPTPGGSDEGTPADVESRSESSPDAPSAPSQEDGQESKDGDAQGEAQTGESESKEEGGKDESKDAGEEGKDAPAPAPKGTPEDAPKDEEGKDAPAPEPCPQGDAPPPPPEREGMMEASIRAIAKEEAARAVYPVAQWLNTTLVPHIGTLAARMGGGADPLPGSQGYAPPTPKGTPPAPRLPREGNIQHRLFPKFVALASAGVQCLLVGPGGTGKSHAARALAQHLGYSYGDQSLSSGVSESALLGWLLPMGEGGACRYVPSPFVTLYAQGNSVFLMDEIGAASPDMLIIANAALANGGFTVPQRMDAPYVVKGANGIICGATNVVDGADDMYAASQAMDAATFDRFYPLHWGHDPVLERAIVGLPGKQTYWTPKGIANWEGKEAEWTRALECGVAWVNAVAKAAATHRIPRLIGTRKSVQYRQALAVGCTHKEIRQDLLMAWGPDELAKLGDAHPKNAPVVGAEPTL